MVDRAKRNTSVDIPWKKSAYPPERLSFMFFSLYSLLEFSLLILNGLAIINRERVLNKYLKGRQHSFDSADSSIVLRFITLIVSIQTVLRVPLIVANSIVIVLKLVFG